MKTKRAFTLIELLVVIAIIAILAAILFPVFAQAKLAAKKTASLSNVKQITLSNLMYANDYDDYFVLATQNFYDDGCGPTVNSGTTACLLPPYTVTYNWDLLLQPYIKSLGLFVDPGTGDPQGYFGSGANAIPAYQNVAAQYSYNYEFLSPILILGLNSGGWLPTSFGIQFAGAGRSQTQGVHPSTTVMITAAQGSPVVCAPGKTTGCTLGTYSTQFATPDGDFGIDPGNAAQLYYATDRLTLVGTTSGQPHWVDTWVKNTPIGELTANVRCLSPYNGSPTGFVDGHAKSLTADQLAAGTDFGTSTTSSGGGFGSLVNNVNNYIWTLDGTMGDAGKSPQFPSGY